jgi:hypothetical protein
LGVEELLNSDGEVENQLIRLREGGGKASFAGAWMKGDHNWDTYPEKIKIPND